MVFYFTGTGNSLYAAKQFDREIVSIPQIIHNDSLEYETDKIGIVCPVYGHEMPEMVKDFLKKAVFKTDYFYIVLTYGNIHGGAAELAEKALNSFGKKADYINTLEMVDNFLPVFDMNEQTALIPQKKIDENIEKIKADIDLKKHFKQAVTDIDRDFHNKFIEACKKMPLDILKNSYKVTDNCIGCGICTNVCPEGRIHLENQKAFYGEENCQMCMACIHHCPTNAIQLNIAEKNPQARYSNENIKLTEIVKANNQKN